VISDLPARVRRDCDRHGLLPHGPVLALVSGGPDSACLLDVLVRIHVGGVAVLTVDHGLRPEAAGEAEAVARGARERGLAAHVAHLGLAPGAALQERARDARRAAALEVAERHRYAAIATGHTASDQAETVLFRLARGTGRTGALGMTWRDGPLVRPLLGVTAEETRAWCARQGIPVADDPSNRDPAFARTRVRHGLVPALAAVHPSAERHVAGFAERLRDEAEVLDAAVDAAWERCRAGGGLDAASLLAERPALARLLVRRLIGEAGLPGEARAAEPVGRVLLAAARGARADLPGGLAVVERGVVLVAPNPPAPPARLALAVPGSAAFAGSVLTAAMGAAAPPRPRRVAVRVDDPLEVRSPRPGDRVALPQGGRQAVGRLLAAAGVPARLRPLVPVVASGDRVVWVAGHRAAPDLLAPPGCEAVVLTLEGS
jgi:tRNA(Ile)-lysidine synthase